MEKRYVIYKVIVNDILFINKNSISDIESSSLKISLFNNKRIKEIFKCIKMFDETTANDIVNNNDKLQVMSEEDFHKFILMHKCKCSTRCQKFIWGGFYNIPDVGGINVSCYDRISRNGKLSAYQVMLSLRNKKNILNKTSLRKN